MDSPSEIWSKSLATELKISFLLPPPQDLYSCCTGVVYEQIDVIYAT